MGRLDKSPFGRVHSVARGTNEFHTDDAILLLQGNSRAQGACPARTHVLRLKKGVSWNTGESLVVTVCSICEKPERQCACEKYCCFCQSQYNIHMGVDGLYYCPDCREACDVRLADKDEH